MAVRHLVWLSAILSLGLGVYMRTAHVAAYDEPSTAQSWFQQKGFVKTGEIPLTFGKNYSSVTMSDTRSDCQVYLVELDKPEAVQSLLSQLVDPSIWDDRRLWFDQLFEEPVPIWKLHLWRLWYRASQGEVPPVPAYVLAENHQCYS